MVRLSPKKTPFRYSLGTSGEALACDYLVKKGYRILERNFRSPLGEIDVIAEKNGRIIFLEVKTRTSHRFGPPQEAVHIQKQRKIGQIAKWYLKKKQWSGKPAGFDVIGVTRVRNQAPGILHIENAFELTEQEFDKT